MFLDDKQYRIARVDSHNLAIQKLTGGQWRTISYHGSSVSSLAGGLTDLIVSHYIPDPDNGLAEQLGRLIDATEFYSARILVALDGADIK